MGWPIKLSRDPNDRAIAGASSGAICAFTVAWERPDAFRRVFSTIGTYVGLRGGDCYPTLIRKTEPKPLRVFLQDGSTDLNNYGGDWWMANQTMERALIFSGYQVNHAWGDGGHSTSTMAPRSSSRMPMRWLWKDWPDPPKTGAGSPQMQELLVPDEGPGKCCRRMKQASALAANATGEVVFDDAAAKKTFRVGIDGKVSPASGCSRRRYRPGVWPRWSAHFDRLLVATMATPYHDHRIIVCRDGSPMSPTRPVRTGPRAGKSSFVCQPLVANR